MVKEAAWRVLGLFKSCFLAAAESLARSASGTGNQEVAVEALSTMIRFDVSVLVQARLGTSLALNIDTGPQHLTDLEVDFLRGPVQAIRVQDGLLVRGTVESQLGLECVRCLEPFVFPIVLDLEETFRLSGTDNKPDGVYAVDDDNWLDLAPLLREQAWVAIPMKPLCHSGCRGLCPQCGANLNLESCTCDREKVDSRLALLKDLLD